MDEVEERVVSDVATYGWHMITVPRDEHGPGFTYTIGLFKTYGHPELIVFGLPNKVMQRVVAVTADLIKSGRRFADHDMADDVLEGYSCAFRAVLLEHYQDHLGYAMWFNRISGLSDFLALQCVWPDNAGHFPWDPACEAGIRALQPPLYVREH